MSSINLKKEISGPLDIAINQVTDALKAEGFGVLTRIDLHTKVKEKLGKDMLAVTILGACNPQLAFEAYSQNSDVASLLPCNAVLRDTGNSRISVELVKPSALMQFLGDEKLVTMALDADRRLQSVLNSLTQTQILEWSSLELSEHLGECELLDVRGLDEFDGPLSHIVGARLVTLGPDLDSYLVEKTRSPSKKPLVFICRSGARSMKAALQARELGISNVVNLKGGMIEWNDLKFPTHSPKSGGK